jgi:hypothetical protein
MVSDAGEVEMPEDETDEPAMPHPMSEAMRGSDPAATARD